MSEDRQTDGRLLCIIAGTCITYGVKYLLLQSEEFTRKYRIIDYITSQNFKVMSDFNISDEEINEASVFIYHPPGWADWGNDDAYREFLRRIPDHVLKISYPYPVFHALWPLHSHEKRLDDPARKPRFGQLDVVYRYGDGFVLSLMRQNLPRDEIIRRYLDLNIPDVADVDGILKRSIETQLAKEETTDIKIVDFVAENFRTKRAFLTMNHVGNISIIYMVNQMLKILGFSELPKNLHDALFELIDPQVPIHPSIIKYFDLTCVHPDMRYRIDPRRNLTFSEYLAHYIDLR